MVVIANDITVQIGSFGTKDDLLFQRASELARFAFTASFGLKLQSDHDGGLRPMLR